MAPNVRLIFVLLLFSLFAGCNKQGLGDKYALHAVDVFLSFQLDDDTRQPQFALWTFEDNGSEYLSFDNRGKEILFYKITSGELVKKVCFEKEGANGIGGSLDSYSILDFNHIYIPAQNGLIYVSDTSAVINQRIDYSKTDEGSHLTYFNIQSFIYNPLYFVEGKLYIPQPPNPSLEGEFLSKSPVSAVIDTANHSIKALPLNYLPTVSAKDVMYSMGGLAVSRCYDGENFLYSFYESDTVYKASADHKIIEKYSLKSKYIDKVEVTVNRDWDLDRRIKQLCEQSAYGNLIYDKYRKVYYRFVYPKTELEDRENYMNILHSGKKSLAIMIIDEKMNVIGETRLPDYTYNPNIFFIRKDGLYLSVSHIKRLDYDDNMLRFQRLELIKL